MNNETETALLISLVILVVAIVFIIWRYGIRRETPERDTGALFNPPGFKDNLTLINGIGATLESRLNELGITSFSQIAEFDDSDIERVNEKLSFKGRIQREGWVAQARKLVEAGTGSDKPAPDGKTGTRKKTRRKTAGMKKATKKATRKSAKASRNKK